MSKRLKYIIYGVLTICLITLITLWFYDPEFEHIEDTNGIDNYSLTTITDRDIVKLNSGPLYETSDDKPHGSKPDFSIFSGVMEIYSKDCVNENLQIDVTNIKITKGNLRVILLVDDEIMHDFNINESSQSFVLNEVSGHVAIRIAGESAKFKMEYYVK